jgi:hypothetical protein
MKTILNISSNQSAQLQSWSLTRSVCGFFYNEPKHIDPNKRGFNLC